MPTTFVKIAPLCTLVQVHKFNWTTMNKIFRFVTQTNTFVIENSDFITICALILLEHKLACEQHDLQLELVEFYEARTTELCDGIKSKQDLYATCVGLINNIISLKRDYVNKIQISPQSGLTKVGDVNEKMGIGTTMVEDALIEEEKEQFPDFDLISGKVSSNIADFLARPQQVVYGGILTSNTGMWLGPRDILGDWLSVNSAIRSKLDGFFGMRFTTCIKFVVNAEKFHQGRMILGCVPIGGYKNNPVANYVKFHASFLENRIQCPHVEIDLGTETEMTLRIPWNQASTMAPIQDLLLNGANAKSGFPGYYFVSNYLPFRVGTGGSTSCSYTIYIWLEDVELYGLVTQSGIDKVRRDVAQRMATMDGDEVPDPLSLTEDSYISNNRDDSSIVELLKRPSLVSMPTWTSAGIVGYQIASISVTPYKRGVHTDTLGGFSQTYYSYTPMGVVAGMCGFWRGDIRVVIKISKTTFHSGRLAILFVPSTKGLASEVVSNYTKDALFQRIIWDIRECNSIEFVVPYTNISPWCTYSESIGNIVINIVNPLVAPESASGTVDLAVEYYGTDSLEFSYPRQCFMQNYVPLTYQSGLDPVQGKNIKVDDFIHVNPATHKVVHFGGLNIKNPSYAKRCMGENITSLKDRISRYSAYDVLAPSAEATHVGYQPFQINMAYITTDRLTDPSNGINDVIDVVLSGFCLNSGSMEYKILSSFKDVSVNGTSYGGNMQIANYLASLTFVGWSGTAPTKAKSYLAQTIKQWLMTYGNCSIAYSRSDINGGVEIRVPQYQIDPYRSAANYMTTANSGTLDSTLGSANHHLLFRTDIVGEIVVFRRIAKDFLLRNFVSFGTYILNV